MKTKKPVSLLVVCVLLLSLFCALPASAAQNLFSHENIDFEKGTLAGWSTKPASWAVSVSDTYANSGTYSLTLSGGGNATSETYQYTGGTADLSIGEEYVFSAMVNIPTALQGESMQLYTKTSEDSFYSSKINITAQWEKLACTFTAGTKNEFFIRLRGGASGTFYIDDIALHKKADLDAEAAIEAALKFNKTSSYEMFDDFENDITGWAISNKTDYLSHSTEQKHQGNNSMKISIPDAIASFQIAYTSTKPQVSEGTAYEVSAWIYVPNISTINNIRLYMEPAMNGEIRQYVSGTKVKPIQGQWFRLAHTFTPNEGHSGNMFNLRVDVDSNAAATLYIDDVAIVKKAAQAPVMQFMAPIKDNSNNDFLVETDSLSKGAFTVKYDAHKSANIIPGNTLLVAIYKTVGGTKQLVEINMDSFAADETSLSIPMTGLSATDNAAEYSMKVMLWNSLSGMKNEKTDSNITFN